MPHNALVTGPPRSGKTTAIRPAVDRLRADGYAVGGIYCPEMREDGDRVGFEIVDVHTGARETMAHVDFREGPSVGKYRVDVGAVDAVAGAAIPAAVADADCVVIDEIAPMELASDRFVAETRAALDADVPVLAAIAEGGTRGFLGEVKAREDVETVRVESETRDALPARLADRVRRVHTSERA
ncbi:nucleoside-triphosphatase [Halovivax sp.]|uniref:nucleoside-triphosphatase n=1 Tax=Halovivax sp. TaxID=1935978 RepID=UPI0025BA02ED|nr:nucleoside-triphosphatase [Halovivax sp.]